MIISYNETDIQNIELNVQKEDLILTLKEEIAPSVANVHAPDYKQRNAALGLLSEAEKSEVLNWVQALRMAVDNKETEINNASDESTLDSIDISYDSLLDATNQIYQEMGMSIRVISKYAFRQRLTQDEKLAIDNYQTNPNISDDDKAMLNTFWKDFELSENVDLDEPALRNGLMYLVSLGLIASEDRVNEILS